jgi:hypothetical protein
VVINITKNGIIKKITSLLNPCNTFCVFEPSQLNVSLTRDFMGFGEAKDWERLRGFYGLWRG